MTHNDDVTLKIRKKKIDIEGEELLKNWGFPTLQLRWYIFQGYGYVAFPQIHRRLRLVFRFWQSGQERRLWKYLQILSVAYNPCTKGKFDIFFICYLTEIFAFSFRKDSNTLRLYWPLQTTMIGSCLPILWSLLQNFNINLANTFLKRILCWFVLRAKLDMERENPWVKSLKNPLTSLHSLLKLWIMTTKV